MARWFGKIGFALEPVETKPGVWDNPIVEREYYGDVLRNNWQAQNSGDVNDNVNVSNRISFIYDPYAIQNFHYLSYIEFMGSFWKVTTAEMKPPRIEVTLGGVWNGKR